MSTITRICKTNLHSTTLKKLVYRCYTKSTKNVENKYSKTVLLPQTKFPARISASKRIEMDNYLIEKCKFNDLYNWQRENLEGPDYILHDGPPYANGSVHMGHAVNKILKDITIRSRVIRGQRVHYVPGWDCHGLPIELKCFRDSPEEMKNLSAAEIRGRARKYAEDVIKEQKEEFMSWGIMADWKDGCYFTYRTSYVTNQLRQFYKMYENNYVFRAFKPVYWSQSSKTALAESELEYNDQHQSKCAVVRFLVGELSEKLKILEDHPVYALIWTTTPWTLVANQAVAYSTDISYCIAEDPKGNYYIVAEDLLNDIIEKIGPLMPVLTIQGKDLEGSRYAHPITGTMMPFLPANYVSSKVGTGLVHTAPAHGNDDFSLCLTNNIPVISLVDENGCYTSEAGVPFTGINVLEKGNDVTLTSIEDNVLHTEMITHSYPYDWRTKKPVICRASNQWFINTEVLKQKAINALENTQMYPAVRQKTIFNLLVKQVMQRPFWCISRQRCWGTPIPVFYNKDTGEVIVNSDIIERLCRVFEREGCDSWWTLPIDKLIGKKLLEKMNLNADNLERGNDIMDVWFDSGISWSSVLPNGQADLYMEGMDQFNGWFQASLLTSVALQRVPPFKSLFAHGFTVDRDGIKMSKSMGNVISPSDIIKGRENNKKKFPTYGIDILRWWVADHCIGSTQIPVVNSVFETSVESVHRIRLVLRFLLGALHPYDVPRDIKAEYLVLDKYMLHQLYHYNKQIQQHYDTHEYQSVCKLILHFIANDVSAMYCYLVKDRLYCEEARSPLRIGAVDIISEVLEVITRSIAPIMPHLAEEVWLYHPDNLASVPLYHSTHTLPDDWDAPQIEKIIKDAFIVKEIINKLVQNKSLEFEATVKVGPEIMTSLAVLQHEDISSTSELCHILQVSKVTLIPDANSTTPQVSLRQIDEALCKRCRKFVESSPNQPCIRCLEILNSNTSLQELINE